MKAKLLNYRVLINKEQYENGDAVYVAHVPTLGISDYGDSVEEVLKSLEDGILLALECEAKDKKEIVQDNLEDQIITSLKIPFSTRSRISFA
jgi:predicted RNase H-like HicB family nuclease